MTGSSNVVTDQSFAKNATEQPVPAAGQLQSDPYKNALAHLPIQRKLTVGAVDDPLEYEADAMADKVMRMPEQPFVQRKCTYCEEKEKVQRRPLAANITPFIQAKEIKGGVAGNAITNQINATKGSGSSMDRPTQSFMESRFGTDFSGVKIHTGDNAVQMSRELNAQAFTAGSNIYFNSGEYNPSSEGGKHLLAHELTHVLQQGSSMKMIQAKFKWDELKSKKSGDKIDSSPDTYFFKGSAANVQDKKAFVLAGIHAKEVSPCDLGNDVLSKLNAGTIQPDLHTIIIPCAVPDPTKDRGAGDGDEHVDDLNREFGKGYTSKNPVANKITQVVNEFNPDQTVSIHAIADDKLGGIYLDPEYTAKYPITATATEKENAFTSNPDNEEAMHLAEDMITASRVSENITSGFKATTGNNPGVKSFTRKIPKDAKTPAKTITKDIDFPQNKYPAGGRSPFSILYPQQDQIDVSKTPTSLGVWMAGLGKTILTIELPGYKTQKSIWQHFVPAVERFLKLPSNRVFAPAVYSKEERLKSLTGMLDKKKAGLTFGAKNDIIDLNGGKTFKLDKTLDLREESYRCMEVMMKDADAAGHAIKPFSGTRTFEEQAKIWREKFEFTRKDPKGWGSMDAKSLKAKTKECADLPGTDTVWHSDEGSQRFSIHKKCWEALSGEEKAREILKTSSGPGFSRHHWGTEIDINSDDPKAWETEKTLIDLYAWLTKNAYKYGYYQAFNAGRTRGYSEEKWHWSFAPLSVPIQKEYEDKVLPGTSDGHKLLTDKLAGVKGNDVVMKLFKEYVEEINPGLRGNKKTDRPACMPAGTGADIPAWASIPSAPKEDTKIGKKIKKEYEDCIIKKSERPAGVPSEEEMGQFQESCSMETGYASAVSSGDIHID